MKAVINECERRGIRLWVKNGTLRYDAPKGALTDELRATLKTHKAEVVALLQRRGLSILLADACRDLLITPDQIQALMTDDDMADIEAGDISLEALRAYAESMNRPLEDIPVVASIVSSGSSGVPDSEHDDRRHCNACQNHIGGYCKALLSGRRVAVMDSIPRRCLEYLPLPEDHDRRTGRERWPTLVNPTKLERTTP